ncbi:MAG TPA: hypothetical protein VFV50_19585, partial [Bdellovibrionales bacterium]|nr:hypothetical protein [Bdellovibrionales bacterium]
THPYLKQVTGGDPSYCVKNKLCHDICQTPPLFVYGGKSKLEAANRLNVSGFVNKPVTRNGKKVANWTKPQGVSGLDCSGFVGASMHLAGLKIRKNAGNNNTWTEDLLTMGQNPANDCMEPVTLRGEDSFTSGDVVVWKGHTFMIESASRDPLGVKTLIDAAPNKGSLKADDCSRLMESWDPQKTNMMLIMSGTMQTAGIGVLRVRAQDYFPKAEHYGSWLKRMAVQSCKAQLPGGQASKAIEPSSGPRDFAVLRHRGGPGCSYPNKPTLKCEGKNCEAGQ